MTAFISEYRSMTFQCKSEISSAIQFSEINNYVGRNHSMAPQQHETLAKSSDRVLESDQSRENQVSPVSSVGTSMESSSPTLPNMTTPNNINQNYELEHSQIADPSSDDSGSITNDLSSYQEELTSPLEQLQCSLGKDGMLGQKLHLSEYPGQKDDIRNSSNASLSSAEQSCIYYDSSELYKCHLCNYASNSKQEFNIHMNSHFDHKCPYCDYTSRTEGRLKRHVKDFHSETPPESWAGTRVPRAELSGAEQSMDDSVTSSNGKSRSYRCKQCDFVAYQKTEFWEHNKSHIKAEKLLSCPQCAFVTEYKHHLEYHIRNHFGSKPFKCSKCNYSCVNKSMLNSHMKSHSNIYQYRCSNCTYATKYCHSLKLHLRKYEHKPATVLNLDGTPNPYPVIDVYGTRRGPRTKKRRCLDDSESNSVSSTAVVPSQSSMNFPSSVPLLPPNVPVVYPSQFFNGYPNSMYMKPHPHPDNSNYPMGMAHGRVKPDSPLKCTMCEFVTERSNHELFHKHMILHAAAENDDIVKLYALNSDSLFHLQDQVMFNSYLQSRYYEYNPRTERNNFGSYEVQKERQINGYDPEAKAVKDEEENSISSQRNLKNPSPRNDSRKALSSPCANTSGSPYGAGRPDNSEDNERSVIVAHKSSPRPSPSVELMETEISDTSVKNVEHSPLDLSGPKLLDSAPKIDKIKNPEVNLENEELKNVSPNGADPSLCQRNRRKGKAFKIDHYKHYDHPSNTEMLPTENNENNIIELQSNEVVHSQQNDLQPAPVTTNKAYKPLSPEQLQHMPFQFLNSENTFTRNGYISPNCTSPLNRCRSPDEEHPVALSKNSSPIVPKENNQLSKERHSENKQNSTPEGRHSENKQNSTLEERHFENKQNLTSESALLPKVEIEQEKIFKCECCAMTFKDCVMHAVHMGYHGYGDPFTCNMCGQRYTNRVEFFIHIARAAHM